MSRGLRNEADDLLLLVICASVTVLGWWLFLGWDSVHLAGASDATLYLSLIRTIADHGGRWTQALYTPAILGGIALHGVYGTVPSFDLGASAGIAPVTLYNATVFGTQTVFAFLGTRATSSLACLLRLDETFSAIDRITTRASWLVQHVAVPCSFAFLPVLGWRIGQGHLSFVWGLLPFLAAISLTASARACQGTWVLAFVAFVGLLHSFQSCGYQIEYYSILFGLPLVVSIGLLDTPLQRPLRLRSVAFLLAPFALALVFSVSKLTVVLGYLRSSDTIRSPRETATYRYLIATAWDWLASLPWSYRFVAADTSTRYAHEIHYALGPSLGLLLIVPWRRCRAIGLALAWSALGPVLLSIDARPFSVLLLKVPLMAAFRVPARGILPFTTSLMIVTSAAMLSRLQVESRPKWERAITGRVALGSAVAVALFLWCSGPSVGEITAWAAVLATVLLRSSGSSSTRLAPVWIIGFASVAAFGDRLPSLPGPTNLVRLPALTDQAARSEGVRGDSILDRAIVRNELDNTFGPNAAFFARRSSVEGYGNPPRRLVLLANAVGARLPAFPNALMLEPGTPTYRALGQLYNVGAVVVLRRGVVQVMRPGSTAGSAWFGQRAEHVASFAALGERLLASRDLSTRLHEVVWIVDEDPVARHRSIATNTLGACTEARVLAVRAPWTSQTIELDVSVSDGPCLLAISTNFLEILRASVLVGNTSREAQIVPVYGALTGVVVASGARRVALQAGESSDIDSGSHPSISPHPL